MDRNNADRQAMELADATGGSGDYEITKVTVTKTLTVHLRERRKPGLRRALQQARHIFDMTPSGSWRLRRAV